MKLTLNNRMGACPVCGEDLIPGDIVRGDGECRDLNTCSNCELGVIYVTPDDGRREYHLFNDGEIEIRLER